mmetsp:Transcript_54861/g.158709  ORF Transcript_54861/g.158709 Transcript_54861/m.158709 type:complete len:341 (-) Transcript_54861:1943-2965(-)
MRTSFARASGNCEALTTCTCTAKRVPSNSSGSSTTSSSGTPTVPSRPIGLISTRNVPAVCPSVLKIRASKACSTWRSTPSNNTCEQPMSRSTSTGSQRGSSSSESPSTISKPSSSQRCKSSRNKNTRFSKVSGVHSKRRTFSLCTQAITRITVRFPAVRSQCIFVSKRWGRFNSCAMRFASFTNGITNINSSSNLCIACSWCRCSSSSAAAFFAAASSSWMRRAAAASALRCLSTNSCCKRASSSACFCLSSAAFISSADFAFACSSIHSACRFSICALNSSSRCRRSSSASCCALSFASCASFTFRSSSSAISLLAFNSSSDAPPISPCASANSFRAMA